MSKHNRRRQGRRPGRPSPRRSVPQHHADDVVPAFQDRDDYLRCLGEEVAEALGRSAVAGLEADEHDAVGHTPPSCPGSRSPAPCVLHGRRCQTAPTTGTAATGGRPELAVRYRATKRAIPHFSWPDAELALATGLPRHLAAAIGILRCAEREDCWDESVDVRVLASLAVSLMAVPARRLDEVVAAMRPGGELERRGLMLADQEESPYEVPYREGWLPITVRRFVDGLPSLLRGKRLAQPGEERAEEWFSLSSGERLLTRFERVEALRSRIGGNTVLSGGAQALGRVRVGWPSALDGGRILGAVATLLDRTVVDGRSRPGERAPARHELLAAAQIVGGVVVLDAGPQRGSHRPRHRHHHLFDFAHAEAGASGRPWPPEVAVLEFASVDRTEPPPPEVLLLDPPDEDQRAAIWEHVLEAVDLGSIGASELAELVTRPLYRQEIVAAGVAVAKSIEEPAEAAAALLKQVTATASASAPATDITPATRLADVILSPALREQAEEGLAACRDGGRALQDLRGTVHDSYGHVPVFLFTGPPGTGKTYTAEAYAGELGLPLRRVSGPDVRSMWVGESGKAAVKIFNTEDDVVLFFDECDGFLTPRGSGPSARHDDKLAVVLLEQIERTKHVTLLATNLRLEDLDPALARRVQFHLRFEAPGPDERAALWALHLPAVVPGASDVDCARVAKIVLTGGQIKNASFRAILRARRAGLPLTTEAVEIEARREVGPKGPGRGPAGFRT